MAVVESVTVDVLYTNTLGWIHQEVVHGLSGVIPAYADTPLSDW